MPEISNNLVNMQKNGHFPKLCNLIVLFTSIGFFAMLESTESVTHTILLSVGVIKIIWFY